MLAYLLAILVGLGSFALYMAAFFFPELHRKYDLTWSGVGLFYALVLWVCADRIRGGLLLGQIASVALMGWFCWQTLELRWQQTPIDQRTQVSPNAESLSEVVREQIEKLTIYLQSEEFKSRLPRDSQDLSARTTRLLKSAKEVILALVNSTFKSAEKPQD